MNLYHRKCHYCSCVVDLSKPEYVTVPYTGILKFLDKISSVIAIPGAAIYLDNRYACISCNRDIKINKII